MRNVIVTGGSRGLGLAITEALAQDGYRVLVVARRCGTELEQVMTEANGQAPGSVCFSGYDLAEVDGLHTLVASLRKEHGPFHGLVNNAGMSIDGALALVKVSDMERVVRLNTLSPMVLTKYVVRSMMADGGGRIVNLSSIAASTGFSGLAVYAATKASLVGFTRSLAREVGRMGVTVNAVAPGFVDTELTQGLTGERRDQIVRRSAMKRLAAASDIADAVAFLLSERAKNITGTVLTVDAGSTA